MSPQAKCCINSMFPTIHIFIYSFSSNHIANASVSYSLPRFSVSDLIPFPYTGVNTEKLAEDGQALIMSIPPIDSYPAPTVQWNQRGVPIPSEGQRFHVTLQNQLVILDIRLNQDNNKEYQATANNGFAAKYSTTEIYRIKVKSE